MLAEQVHNVTAGDTSCFANVFVVPPQSGGMMYTLCVHDVYFATSAQNT